jgi:hypothetical protein
MQRHDESSATMNGGTVSIGTARNIATRMSGTA